MANIHWFPGHMKKALNELSEKIKLVDIVIELLDARAPISSINLDLEKLISNKKKLVILTKIDLADTKETTKLKDYLKKQFDDVILANINDKNIITLISSSIRKLGKDKHDKEIKKGMKPQPLKTAIIGIPNVGKSSLINKLANRKIAGVENRPGLTRSEQWVKVNNDFLLLDTPGILPMNYEDKKKATHLALIGSIKEEILPNTDLVQYAISFLKEHYPSELKKKYDVDLSLDYHQIISEIAIKRCLKKNNDELDILRAESLFLKELKEGKIGRISFDIL